MIRLVTATPDDAPALAGLHLAVWRETYGGIAPPDAVEALDLTHRRRAWEATLHDPATTTRIAVLDGTPLALICTASAEHPASHPAFASRAEIRHLYVHRAHRGTGLGARLLADAFARLRDAGTASVGLSVVHENEAARAFYARMGGRDIGRFRDPGPLWRSDDHLVVWDLSETEAPGDTLAGRLA